jgi:hypothetical protein
MDSSFFASSSFPLGSYSYMLTTIRIITTWLILIYHIKSLVSPPPAQSRPSAPPAPSSLALYRVPDSVVIESERSRSQTAPQNNSNFDPNLQSAIDKRAAMIRQRELEQPPAYNEALILQMQSQRN